MKIDYLDDIMTKANYALSEKEIDNNQWLKIILAIINIIEEKYKKDQENVA